MRKRTPCGIVVVVMLLVKNASLLSAADAKRTAQENMMIGFEGDDFGDWTTTGTAFGNGPKGGVASSDHGGDAATGTLTSPKFTINRGYINFLINGGTFPDDVNAQLMVDGTAVRSAYGCLQFAIANDLGDSLFWWTWDVEDLRGSTAAIVVNDNRSGKWGRISVGGFEQSDSRRALDELWRPQFHITGRWARINDPNGLVFYDGEYHVFHQAQPTSRKSYWGHLVSTDLIHWKYLPHAITPVGGWDGKGPAAYSGSAVVDAQNTSGFQTGDEKPIVAIWTAIGSGQYIAYSNDRGRTFTWFKGNPVVPKHRDDRDPMVRWHARAKKWVMALPETHADGRILAFYVSDDLKKWTHTSNTRSVGDCPDFYKLPVDGDPANEKWILYGGQGHYRFGSFDGTAFTEEKGGHQFWKGTQYATQTFDNAPDGRRIMMVWVVSDKKKIPQPMPYSQMLSFPTEISLRTFPEGLRAVATPVKEIELLHKKSHRWADETIVPAGNLLSGLNGKLFDIRAEFEIGTASEFGFRIRGPRTVAYDVEKKQAVLNGKGVTESSWDMTPVNNRVKIQILVDRSLIEAFFDGGRAYLVSTFFPDEAEQSLEIFSTGGDTKLISLDTYELKSSWDRQ